MLSVNCMVYYAKFANKYELNDYLKIQTNSLSVPAYNRDLYVVVRL